MTKSISNIGKTFLNPKIALLIGGFSVAFFSSKSVASEKNSFNPDSEAKFPRVQIPDSEILKNSQISYRAEGGFTGINSYGIIISCVNGHISMLKSLHDPRRHQSTLHERGLMNHEAYLRLWKELKRQGVFSAASVPEPKMEIADQFTLTFEAKAGNAKHQFSVHGIARPEACQQFAIKSLIDASANMHTFIGAREYLARR